MPGPAISVVDAADRTVWRVGRAPDPWAWIDRQYAGHQRWDDADGVFRTVYAGDSLYGCYVEVLAYSRPDVEPDVRPPGGNRRGSRRRRRVPRPGPGVHPARLDRRTDGHHRPPHWALRRCPIGRHDRRTPPRLPAAGTAAEIPRLRRRGPQERRPPRELTQRVASYLYALTDDRGSTLVDGVRFASRHGDELTMWGIFERPGDEPASHHLTQTAAYLVDVDDPDLRRAMSLHRLAWRD